MKSLKKLLVPVVFLVVLIVAVVIAVVVSNKSDEVTEESAFTLLKYHPSDIVSLTVERKDKDPLVIKSQNGTDGEVSFYIEDDELVGKKFSQDSFKFFLTPLIDYSVTAKIDSQNRNLADYGLSNPEYKITFTTTDGSNKVVSFGDDIVSGGQCYIKVDGDDNIYTVASAKKNFCDYDAAFFFDKVNMNVDFKNVDTVVFERSDNSLSDAVSIKCSTSIADTGEPLFELVEPYSGPAGTFLSKLFVGIGSIDISSFTYLSEEEVKEYGVDNPVYHFTYNFKDGSSRDFYLSKLVDGVYYGYSSITDEYFKISDQQIEYLNSPIKDYLSSYIVTFNIKEISKIECVTDDVHFIFDIYVPDKISDEESDLFLNTRDAKIYSSTGRCYGAILFETVSSIKIDGADLEAEPVLENPALTLSITYTDHLFRKYDFVNRGTDSYYCFVDGVYTGYYVAASELYNDGGIDTYNYGVIGAYRLLTTAIEENVGGIYDLKVD